jgi:hypothetical protein
VNGANPRRYRRIAGEFGLNALTWTLVDGVPSTVYLLKQSGEWVASTQTDDAYYEGSPARTRDFAVDNLVALYLKATS